MVKLEPQSPIEMPGPLNLPLASAGQELLLLLLLPATAKEQTGLFSSEYLRNPLAAEPEVSRGRGMFTR